jgi:protein-tyrosine phosphatase
LWQILFILLKIHLIIAFLGVAGAFWLEKPNIFLKKHSGSFSLMSYLIFWPYFVLNIIALALFRLFSKENAIDEIIPDLYLGCQLNFLDYKRFLECGIKSTVDLTCEFSEVGFIRKTQNYLSVPVLDTKAPTLNQLDKAVSWIMVQKEKGPVFVHCALGHGRSATVVAAFLIQCGIVNDVQEAVDFMKIRRSRVRLHPEQLKILTLFAQSCILASNN